MNKSLEQTIVESLSEARTDDARLKMIRNAVLETVETMLHREYYSYLDTYLEEEELDPADLTRQENQMVSKTLDQCYTAAANIIKRMK